MNSKKVLICSNYAWTIHNFRMPLIRSLKKQGYIVEVVTQFDGYENHIKQEVDDIHNLLISRKGTNPLTDFITLSHLIIRFFRSKPDLVLLFTIKPVIYGLLASKFFSIPCIPTITGLGTTFIKESIVTRIIEVLYRIALSSASLVFFQNNDDIRLFTERKLIDTDNCRLSPGSGLDLNTFPEQILEPSDNMTFLLIARMLWDKGIWEYVEAARVIKTKYPNVSFQLLGPLGVENRTAIASSQMTEWQEDGVIEYLGETDNVASYIERACCVVLPSYREGTSRVLLESAAMCRPLIASDVPGCREVVEDSVTGLLCKPKDFFSLSQKMEIMINLPHETRISMGKKGRQKIQDEFNEDIVCDLYIDAVRSAVA